MSGKQCYDCDPSDMYSGKESDQYYHDIRPQHQNRASQFSREYHHRSVANPYDPNRNTLNSSWYQSSGWSTPHHQQSHFPLHPRAPVHLVSYPPPWRRGPPPPPPPPPTARGQSNVYHFRPSRPPPAKSCPPIRHPTPILDQSIVSTSRCSVKPQASSDFSLPVSERSAPSDRLTPASKPSSSEALTSQTKRVHSESPASSGIHCASELSVQPQRLSHSKRLPVCKEPSSESISPSKRSHHCDRSNSEKLAPPKSSSSETVKELSKRSSHSEKVTPKRSSSKEPHPSINSQKPAPPKTPSSESSKRPPSTERSSTPKSRSTDKGPSVSFQCDSSINQDSTKSVQSVCPPSRPKSILKRIPPPPPPYPPPTTSSSLAPPPPTVAPPPPPPLAPPPPPLTPPPTRSKTPPSSKLLSSKRQDSTKVVKEGQRTCSSNPVKRSCSAESETAETNERPPYNTSCPLSLSSVLDDLCLTTTANSSSNTNNIKKVCVRPANEKSALPVSTAESKVSKSKNRVTDRKSHPSGARKTKKASSRSADDRGKKKDCRKGGESITEMETQAPSSSSRGERDESGIATLPLDPGGPKPGTSKKKHKKSKLDRNINSQGDPKHLLHQLTKPSFKKPKHKRPAKQIIPGSPSFIPPEKTKARVTSLTGRPRNGNQAACSKVSQLGSATRVSTAQTSSTSDGIRAQSSITSVPSISTAAKTITRTANPVTTCSSAKNLALCSTTTTGVSGTAATLGASVDASKTVAPSPVSAIGSSQSSARSQSIVSQISARSSSPVLVSAQSKAQSESTISQNPVTSTITCAPSGLLSSSFVKGTSVHLSIIAVSSPSVATTAGHASSSTTTPSSSVAVCSTGVQTSATLSVASTAAKHSSIGSSTGPGEGTLRNTGLSIPATSVDSDRASTCTDPVPMELDTDTEGEPLTSPSNSSSANVVPESFHCSLASIQHSKKTAALTETTSVHNKPLSTPNILTSPLTSAGSPQGPYPSLEGSVADGSSLTEVDNSLMDCLSQRTVDTLTEMVEQRLAEITGEAVSTDSDTSRPSIQKDTTSASSDETIEENLQRLQEKVFQQADELKRVPVPSATIHSATSQKRRKGRVPVRRLVSEVLTDSEASDTETRTNQRLQRSPLLSTLLSPNVHIASPVPVTTGPLLSTPLSTSHQSSVSLPATATWNSPLASAAQTTPITSLALSSSRPLPPLVSSSTRASTTSAASAPSSSVHATHSVAVSSSNAPAGSCTVVGTSMTSSNATASSRAVSGISVSTFSTPAGGRVTNGVPSSGTTVVSRAVAGTSVESDSTVAVFTTEASTGQTLKTIHNTTLVKIEPVSPEPADMTFDLPPPAPPAPVIEPDVHGGHQTERLVCSWSGCSKTVSLEFASTQLCSEHGDFAQRIRGNLGLTQCSSPNPNSSSGNDESSSIRPALFRDTVGVLQQQTSETISALTAMGSVNDQQVSTGADARDPAPPLLSTVKMERKEDIMEASAMDETTPTAPPTSREGDGGDILTALIDGEDGSGDKEGHTWLRRSSRKSRRARHFSEDSEAHLSDIEIRRKQKAMSSGASQLGRMSGKRRRASGVEASRGEKAEGAGQESSAKRVCQRERRKSTTCTVDFQPLELGSKFKVEIETLNREERAVFGCILECHSVYSKLCHSESATITETDPHSSDKLRAKNKLKKLTEDLHQVLVEKQALFQQLRHDSAQTLMTNLTELNQKEQTLQGELQVVQQEMDRHHNWMVQAALKIQNIREQKKTEQRKIDSLAAQYQSILWKKWELLGLVSSSSTALMISAPNPSNPPFNFTHHGSTPGPGLAASTSSSGTSSPGPLPNVGLGFNRHSNTGSLAAQPPPTVVHSSCSSFVSSPSSSSAKLPVAERFVNRRGNADPLSSQAPPTVVHNIHGLSLGAEPSTGEFGDGGPGEEGSVSCDGGDRVNCDGGDGVSCDGGDRMSCEGGGAVRDGASLVREIDEASASGATAGVGPGAVKHRPVTFNPHGGSVLSLKVHGDQLFTASSDNTIRVYSTKTGKLEQALTYHRRSVTCLELYEKNGNTFLVSGSSDKCVYLHHFTKGKCAEYVLGVRVMCMCLSGDVLYVGLSSGSVLLIDLQRKCALGKHSCHTPDQSVSCLCVSRNLLCTASFDETVVCWDVTVSNTRGVEKCSFKQLRQLEFSSTVLSMKLVREDQVPGIGDRLYLACGDGKLLCYCIQTWDQLYCVDHVQPVSGLEIVGQVLISASFDRAIRCFDLKTLELLQVYPGYPDKLFSLCVSRGMIYVGLMSGAVQATQLDLTQFHPCLWEDCNLRFGISDHLREHLKDHVTTSSTSGNATVVCKWKNCVQRMSSDSLLYHLRHHISSLS